MGQHTTTDTRKPFVPAGAFTGIGSLPHADAHSAIRAVADLSPEIPFWPQLPRVAEAERAVAQGLCALADLIEPRNDGYGYQVKPGRIDSVVAMLHRNGGELTPANASGFGAFVDGLGAGLFPSAAAVKGQIEGPITLATYLFYQDRPFLSDPALFSAIAFHVSQIICWQIDRLKSAGLPVLLFVDEPALCLGASGVRVVSDEQRIDALAATLDGARSRGAFAGLHCCAAHPFERMCRAKPDILSFDAHEGLEVFFSDRHARDFLRNGGTVAYGIVPTWKNLESVDASSLFARWLAAAVQAGDPQELARHSMITATCGLGLLEIPSVADSFRIFRGVGRLVRHLAGVDYEPAGS